MPSGGPVVVALKGTSRCRRTLEWGLDEAARRRAPVVLVRVYEDPVEHFWSWNPLVAGVGSLAEAKHFLDVQEDQARRRRPELAVSARLVQGPVVPSLRDESEEAQLLVVGVGGPEDGHRIGSVAGHVAAHSLCTVAVVRPVPHLPPTDDFDDELDAPVVRPVVVGVDGSRSSIDAAHAAAAAAAARRVPLEIVYASPATEESLSPTGARHVPALNEGRPTHLAAVQLADVLREGLPGLDVRMQPVDDDPADALTAASRRAQLLVVGSRGTGAFHGMLLGSVSDHVVHAAACTVLVVRGERDA
jgi:nucleotide-binding universal stress UspA family protein